MSQHVKDYLSGDEALQMLHAQFSHSADLYRFLLMRRVMHLTGGVIQHGPLAGFNIGKHATWREEDNASKVLGFYEQEVCALLERLVARCDVLVDLGGADGFYAVGMVERGLYRESHCFEIEDQSRANIAAIAAANGVADRVHLYGAATSTFACDLSAAGVDFRRAAVLVDIESNEFDVLTAECLRDLRHSHVIVEIHDFMGALQKTENNARLARATDWASR
ncbi:hypothetical protein QZM82_31770 [Burkholderia cepacia]|uniref:hypothetical protein n=1 Tax=Burkholderia cepacia TaxID=292 RepID=UPI002654A296|nr:hypothetical protein [Burkholderia cepacia]MDN7900778.1 hypothetical protein [Burkholderia cepacia]